MKTLGEMQNGLRSAIMDLGHVLINESCYPHLRDKVDHYGEMRALLGEGSSSILHTFLLKADVRLRVLRGGAAVTKDGCN